MNYRAYEAIKSERGKLRKISDGIVIEGALQININESPYTVVMRTPGDDLNLIRGLIYAEDIYKKKKNPKFEILEEKENSFSIINVEISKKDLGKGYMNKRTLLSVSSCGVCGKQDLDAIKVEGNRLISEVNIESLNLEDKFKELKNRQNLFENTGGSHAAAIFGINNSILATAEDIGRHNAVDKAIGSLLNNSIKEKPQILMVSGRVSYEIISKAFIARIPIVAAVSACSSLAIDFAKELGISVIGFARDKNYTIYS